jgi:hypothetical protein
MNEERVFFHQSEIKVTSARFVVASQTFAVRNITSVRATKVEPGFHRPGLLMLFGGAVALIGFFNIGYFVGAIGIAMLAGGIYWAWKQENNLAVVLTTSGGEVTAYQSEDGQLIADIVKALNDSIAAHG